MENAWQAKCAPILASSSSSVASSVQVPSQISKNQIETNMGYCIPPRDVRQSRFQASAMTQVPPSQMQSDFQHASNRVLSSSYQANFRSAAVSSSSISIPNQRLTHDPRDYNHGFGVDVCPLLPSRVSESFGRTGAPFSHGGQDSARLSVTHAGSEQNVSINVYPAQEAYMGSSNASSGRMLHGSNCCTSKKSHPGLSSFHRDQPYHVMGSSRVFCMNKSGDLLLSNTGVLAVVCSCHGLHMSISNFCEHSGFCNVIPGYAVRMDTGETLAQWRKVYFSKRGVRIPEDHKGWEWPEELLSTVGIPRCSAPSVGGIKCSGISDWVPTSVDPECASHSYNKISAGCPHLSQKHIAAVSQIDQQGNSCHQHKIFSAGLPASPKSNMHNTVTDCVKVSPSPNGFTLMKSICQGGLCSGGQLTSSSCNMVSQTGNSYSENLGGLTVKAHINENISVVPERSATSSCIELKLGQPSENCRRLESPTVPAVPSQISDPRKIIFQQGTIYTISAPEETGCSQYAPLDTELSSPIRKEEQSVPKRAFVTTVTNMIGNIETSNNDLSRHSRISVAPTYLATSSGGTSYAETTIPPNDGRDFLPWTRHFQHQVVKSGQICFAGGTASTHTDEMVGPSNADGAVRPSDKSACLSIVSKTLATGHNNSSLASSETRFQLYAKQMEKTGFVDGHTCGNYQYSPVNGNNQLSIMVPNILGTRKPPESGERNCKRSVHVKNIAPRKVDPSTGFGLTFPSQEFCMVMPTTTANPAQSLKCALPSEKEVCFVPSKLGESLRNLALVDPDKQDEMNALLWSNKYTKLQSGGPDLKMRGSLLSLLPSEEQIEKPHCTYKSSMSESISALLCPVLSCQVNNNVGSSSSTSGANLKNLATCRKGFTSYYGETSKHWHGCHDPLAKELPLKGAGTEAASLDTCKNCSLREYGANRCNCISYMLSSMKESEFGGTSAVCGLKKHSPSSEAFKICASGKNIGCSPVMKTILVENGMVKGLTHAGLKSSISQFTGVLGNAKGDHRLMCTHEAAHRVGGGGESGSAFKDFSAENYRRSSKIDGSFKENELSSISSGCSGRPATQVSVEVNKAGSSIVDTEDPVYENDQIVDQGSAVDKCFLPDDATLSQTSSDHLSPSSNIKSSGDCFPKSFYNPECLDHMNEHKQLNILRIREMRSNGLACLKRKRRTNWTTPGTSFSPVGVALSSYEALSEIGYPAKNGGTLPKSLKDSSDMHQAFSRDPSSKRRKTTFSLLQRCSCERHLDRASHVETAEDDIEMEHNNRPDSLNLPDIVAVKKLKQVNSAEVADKVRLQEVNLNNAGAVLKSNLAGFTKANYDKQEDFQHSKMKPIVCGMYGIISSRETIFRLPKIFSLSQVLKTARKCEVEPQVTSAKESKKRSLDGGFCSFGDGKDSRCNKFRRLSWNLRSSSKGSDETSSFIDCTHPSGWSVTNKQGLDKTKTNNTSMSSIWRCAQFKPKFKAVRRRSLCELFIEGEKLSSKHKEDSKNISCTSPKECTYENVGNSDKQLDHSSGDNSGRSVGLKGLTLLPQIDSLCCICGKSNEDQTNCLLECGRCSIRIHQACYGISRLPKGHWYCRPCSTNSVDTVCVLCGYEGGAMTRALRCDNVVKSLLKAWNVPTESGTRNRLDSSEGVHVAVDMEFSRISTRSIMAHNSVTAGLFDPTVKQWIHVVCGLWTPGTRCPNVDTMSSFDVSGVSQFKTKIVCVICKRRGGSSIKCRVLTCSSRFHPWCAHSKGLLQSEPQCVNNEKIGFYGRCMIHAMLLPSQAEADLDSCKIKGRQEGTCARTEGYMGRKQDGKRYNASYWSEGKGKCLVSLEQFNAWIHINRRIMSLKPSFDSSISDIEHDYKKEYARYKRIKGWKQLMVYKSGIHALGLYTCLFIRRSAMVVEYVGEIVGLRVADKREIEYQSGRKLQYKSACYFFRVDKEHIVDATRKGGIARFVNHSCMPNCVAKIITVRNEKKVVFLAQRDIYPGEEITYDYHFNNEDEGKKIPCFCNARNCRLHLN